MSELMKSEGSLDAMGKKDISLRNMISADTVRVKQSFNSWEEAVEQIGNLLVRAGKVKPSYVNAMKRVLQEMGPYAVIAPGIVLLHASSEDGVEEPCVGLITLAQPINFGHSANDPVDIVIAFGAVDKQAHISALKTLAEILGKSENLDNIRSAQNENELLRVFQEQT